VGEINLLVLGGSLGATSFGTLIPAALALLPAVVRARLRLTMQCPEPVLMQARTTLAQARVKSHLSPFFDDVAVLLANAHLVVSRAGGSTVAELAVIGRPAVLIPLTINADQRANAEAMVAAGGAVHVPQSGGAAPLAAAIEALLEDPDRLASMAAAAGRMGIVDAAERLADVVMGVVS
jgi:UDP-N-acetylglucosamine--N-acetylmuramyl-(pentapeptide) pyrophosphoryl-undecaprenol N-acetylglucosamine transferase